MFSSYLFVAARASITRISTLEEVAATKYHFQSLRTTFQNVRTASYNIVISATTSAIISF